MSGCGGGSVVGMENVASGGGVESGGLGLGEVEGVGVGAALGLAGVRVGVLGSLASGPGSTVSGGFSPGSGGSEGGPATEISKAQAHTSSP